MLPSVYAGAGATSSLDLYNKAIELYNAGHINGAEVDSAIRGFGITADPKMQGIVAVAALAINVCVLAAIIKKAKATHTNPYTHEIWKGTKDFEEAMARAE